MTSVVADLALALAKGLSVITGKGLASDLWVHQAIEGQASNPYAVLSVYTSSANGELQPVAVASVQIMAVGSDSVETLGLICSLYDALFTDDGEPRHGWQLPVQLVAGDGTLSESTTDAIEVRLFIPQSGPGIVGRDDRGRSQATLNFDVRYHHVSLT